MTIIMQMGSPTMVVLHCRGLEQCRCSLRGTEYLSNTDLVLKDCRIPLESGFQSILEFLICSLISVKEYSEGIYAVDEFANLNLPISNNIQSGRLAMLIITIPQSSFKGFKKDTCLVVCILISDS